MYYKYGKDLGISNRIHSNYKKDHGKRILLENGYETVQR